MLWHILLGVAAGLVLTWLALVGFLFVVRRPGSGLREVARLLPDTIRLVRRLGSDRTLSAGLRIRLWLLLAYLASPVDLIPDFIPVIGYVDDAIVVAAVLRSVVRRAGPDAVRRHWPGTEDGLDALWRAASIGDPGRSPGS